MVKKKQPAEKEIVGRGAGIAGGNQAGDVLQIEHGLAQQYLDIAGVILVCLAPDQTITLVNKKGCEVLGYAQKELIGKNWFDLVILESERERVKAGFFQLTKGELEPAEHFENHVVTRSGEKRLISWHNTIVRDETGNIVGTLSSGEDITERKQREKENADMRILLQASIESPKDMIIMAIDRDYQYLCFNNAHRSAMKSAYGKDVEIGMNVLDCITSDDDRLNARANYDRAMSGESHSTLQEYGDIEKVYYESFYNPILNSRNEIIGITAFARDITERKRAEEALQQSERKFKNIVEHITDVFFMLDSNREMLYISPQTEQVLGYTVEEVRNNWRSYMTDNPENLAAYEKTTLAFTTGEKQEPYLQEFMHRDGTKRLVEINESPFKNPEGEVIGIVGAIRDVTESKKAEEALGDSEEKYRMVVENAQEAIYIAVDGILKFANNRAAELSGYSREEILSRPFIEFIHPDDRDMVIDRYLRRLKGEDLPNTYSFRIFDKAGDIRRVELTAVLITWQDKPATLNFLTDVTARKLLEEKTLRQNAIRYAISRIFEEALRSDTDVEVASVCLSVAQELSGSKFGWIGEVNASGLLDTIALSDPGWESCRMPQSQDVRMIRDMQVRGIWGRVLKDGKSLITNIPLSHPDSVGLPPGHPQLTAFLGVPLKHTGQTIGMIALANKPGGYDINDQEAIEALSVAFEEALSSKRADEAILRSKLLLQSVIDSTPDWMYVKDSQHKFLLVNKGFAEAQNIAPQDMIGRPDTDFFPGELCTGDPDKGIAGFHADDLQALQGHIVHNPRNLVTWADGSLHIYDTYKIPLTDQSGKIYGALIYSRDITEQRKAEHEREAALIQMRKTMDSMITTMSRIVEMRDPYTAGHQKSVAQLAGAIARGMNLADTRIEHLVMAAKIHDIGKMYVPSDILSKPGKLSDIEWNLIKTHVQGSYDILQDIEFSQPVALMALQHHERLDGSGYPNGLKGDEILLEAKILAVADVVEAMVSHRPYRPALGIDKALDEITQNRGILYDPDAVNICLKLFIEGKFKFEHE